MRGVASRRLRQQRVNGCKSRGSIPLHPPTNPKNMEQFFPLIEAIVVIVALGSSAIIVETIISIIKTLKR